MIGPISIYDPHTLIDHTLTIGAVSWSIVRYDRARRLLVLIPLHGGPEETINPLLVHELIDAGKHGWYPMPIAVRPSIPCP